MIPFAMNRCCAALLLAAAAGCATAPPMAADASALRARAALTQLETNQQLAARAPVAIAEAEQAVRTAENPPADAAEAAHLGYLAERKVEVAQNDAQRHLAEAQLQVLAQERDRMQVAEFAREAEFARLEAGRQLAYAARRPDPGQERLLAPSRTSLQGAVAYDATLNTEMEAIHARPGQRGYVLLLGDPLFAKNNQHLKPDVTAALDRLALVLQRHPDRKVSVEAHSDNAGDAAANIALTQKRAEAVRAYLVSRGIAGARISALGKGETNPIAPSNVPGGAQQNRRVEVIVEADTGA